MRLTATDEKDDDNDEDDQPNAPTAEQMVATVEPVATATEQEHDQEYDEQVHSGYSLAGR